MQYSAFSVHEFSSRAMHNELALACPKPPNVCVMYGSIISPCGAITRKKDKAPGDLQNHSSSAHAGSEKS